MVVASVKNLWFLRLAVQQQLSNVVFAVEEVCMYPFFPICVTNTRWCRFRRRRASLAKPRCAYYG